MKICLEKNSGGKRFRWTSCFSHPTNRVTRTTKAFRGPLDSALLAFLCPKRNQKRSEKSSRAKSSAFWCFGKALLRGWGTVGLMA